MKTRSRGVTLIELLIAVSLLSLLSVGMLMALRVGLNSLDRANEKLMSNRRSVSTQQILRSELEGFIPAMVLCAPKPGVGAKIAFFEGRPQSLRLVSSYSLEEAARGLPRVLEFQVVPGKNDKGVRLIVNESPYTGPVSARAACIDMVPLPEAKGLVPVFPPIVAGAGSFVIADELAFCRFSYRKALPEPEYESWLPVWIESQWPTAVRIEMAPLQAQAASVPLVSATIPIHVNRIPGLPYVEQ